MYFKKPLVPACKCKWGVAPLPLGVAPLPLGVAPLPLGVAAVAIRRRRPLTAAHAHYDSLYGKIVDGETRRAATSKTTTRFKDKGVISRRCTWMGKNLITTPLS